MPALAKKRQHHFEVFRGEDKQWYFRVVHRNGRVIVTSEGYRRPGSAMHIAKGLAADGGFLVVKLP